MKEPPISNFAVACIVDVESQFWTNRNPKILETKEFARENEGVRLTDGMCNNQELSATIFGGDSKVSFDCETYFIAPWMRPRGSMVELQSSKLKVAGSSPVEVIRFATKK